MENRLPSRFNPAEFARISEAVRLVLPISQFKRFSALLFDDSGDVSAQARFTMGAGKVPIAQGNLSCHANVVCQRCMKPMVIEINCDFDLAFICSEDQADKLPENVDPVLMDEHDEISAIDFLEDELILQLPISTLHVDLSLCDAPIAVTVKENQQAEPAKSHKPFSELGKLLKH